MQTSDYADRIRTDTDQVSLPLVRRLAAMLDIDPASISEGQKLPFAWSSILFADVARQSQLGNDGHPQRGDFLPPVPLPRRRFAGRSVQLFQPLLIGQDVTRKSTIADVAEKTGRNGPLVFVTIKHDISGPDGLAYTERQKVVYLEASSEGAGQSHAKQNPVQKKPPTALPSHDWEAPFTPDPVLLFRYSALTFNGHRIHYDLPYTMDVEGYSGLVTNGGITTLMLLEMARQHLCEEPSAYEMRAIKPLSVGTAALLRGARTDTGGEFWCLDDAGDLVMRATVAH